jgi:hypothetical protein
VNPKEDSLDRIRDAFRSYQPRGQQDRMVTLFSGLCRYVGIMDDAPVRMPSPARPRQSVSKKPRPTRQAPADSSKNGVDNGAVRRTIHDDDLPPTLQGLTRELAVIGPTWSQERRNQFMQLLEAVIDFSYPANNPDE